MTWWRGKTNLFTVARSGGSLFQGDDIMAREGTTMQMLCQCTCNHTYMYSNEYMCIIISTTGFFTKRLSQHLSYLYLDYVLVISVKNLSLSFSSHEIFSLLMPIANRTFVFSPGRYSIWFLLCAFFNVCVALISPSWLTGRKEPIIYLSIAEHNKHVGCPHGVGLQWLLTCCVLTSLDMIEQSGNDPQYWPVWTW